MQVFSYVDLCSNLTVSIILARKASLRVQDFLSLSEITPILQLEFVFWTLVCSGLASFPWDYPSIHAWFSCLRKSLMSILGLDFCKILGELFLSIVSSSKHFQPGVSLGNSSPFLMWVYPNVLSSDFGLTDISFDLGLNKRFELSFCL